MGTVLNASKAAIQEKQLAGTVQAKMITGTDEGAYMWTCVHTLSRNQIDGPTYAIIDMGGGSTQLAYKVTAQEAAQYAGTDKAGYFSHRKLKSGGEVDLYVHSNNGYGVMSARGKMFKVDKNDPEGSSSCMIEQAQWNFKGIDFVGKAKAGGLNADECLKEAKDILNTNTEDDKSIDMAWRGPGFADQLIVLTSGIY